MVSVEVKIIYSCEKISIISATLQYSTYRKEGGNEFLLIVFAEGDQCSWGPCFQCRIPDIPIAYSFLLPTSQQNHVLTNYNPKKVKHLH